MDLTLTLIRPGPSSFSSGSDTSGSQGMDPAANTGPGGLGAVPAPLRLLSVRQQV